MSNKAAVIIATGLGSGYSPVAPGTAGSVVGLAVALPFALWGGTATLGGAWYAAVTLVLFAAGVWAAGRAEVIFGQKDCGKIVIDEIAGMLITLYLLPATWVYFTLGFFLFRIMDILKPFPARRIDQRMGGGLGVMMDDVVAGIYANLCLQLIRRYVL